MEHAYHHQWQGGDVTDGKSWWRIGHLALERDDHTCQNYGETSAELGREPDVHHLAPVRAFDDPAEAHELANVVTRCRSCHRNVEAGNSEAPEPSNGK